MTFIQVWQLFALSLSHQHQSEKMSLTDCARKKIYLRNYKLDAVLFYKIGWMRQMTLNEHLTSDDLTKRT